MAGLKFFTLSPSTVRASAATFTSGPYGVHPDRDSTVYITVAVTAISGAGASLTVSLEWSHDGTNWVAADPADAMTAISAVGGLVKGFAIKAPQFRVKEVVAGTTPSVTRVISITYA